MPNNPTLSDLWSCYWFAWECAALCLIEMPGAWVREVSFHHA